MKYIIKNYKKILEIILFFSSLSSIFWFILKILNISNILSLFPISHIIIKGNMNFTPQEDIRQIFLNLKLSKNFVKKDIEFIKIQIEKMSWIKNYIIEKKWPNCLVLNLSEYVPIGIWNDFQLIDYNGTIFNIPFIKKKNINLPKIYFKNKNKKIIIETLLIIKNILNNNNIELKTVNINNIFSWEITLNNNLKLKLGRYDKIKKLNIFIKIYPELIKKSFNEKKNIKYIDLRYNSGVAIKYK
ncbi:ftsQ [Wigglesworthia glossinidia endosymbiont of Glossina brevipalpis]|uniref:FtsQ protein n=1 Tax=Wigglesworthia glossinidia brevipalpis TaxID=36870 RepID=Q8D2Z8_WIGBR|nr:ftsQ [Wigglesworthia glossinidia endosymbiont of Glossina brevipalpis]